MIGNNNNIIIMVIIADHNNNDKLFFILSLRYIGSQLSPTNTHSTKQHNFITDFKV